MLKWFREIAPIRVKMRTLTLIYTGLALLSALCVAGWIDVGSHAATTELAFAILCLTPVIGIVSARAIIVPYVTTVVRMEALAAGDLSSPVEHSHFKDCVGRMTTAMQAFRDTALAEKNSDAVRIDVAAMAESLRGMAAGDLTIRLDTPFSVECEPLRQDFNVAVTAMVDTLRAVIESASALNGGANDISQASDELARRTEQQAASLEQSAAAMQEITARVRETANGASQANAVVAAMRADAEDGGRVVRQAVTAMSGIERASQEISEIISVIDGIAFQTNLLALNAGVEAARAGDAGRGFAVVASEVRALAQRSADAAKDVKAKITASGTQVDIGVALVGDTGRALERIVTRVAEVSALVSTIASSAEQQSSGLQQVNIAVGEMDSVTQQNAAMVEESTAAARNLATESDALTRHVARFRLGAAGRPARAAPAERAVARIVATPKAQRRPGAGVARTSGALALKVEPDADDWSRF